MGSRDYRHKETKKPKKNAKATEHISLAKPVVQVEVLKKGKKDRGEEEA